MHASQYIARLHDDNVALYVIQNNLNMGTAVINMNRHMLTQYLHDVDHTLTDQELVCAAASLGPEKVVDVVNALGRDVLIYSDDSDDPRRYMTILQACSTYGIRHVNDDESDVSAVTLSPNYMDAIADFKEHVEDVVSEDSVSISSSIVEDSYTHTSVQRPVFYLSLPDDRTVDYNDEISSYKHSIIYIPEDPYQNIEVPELPSRKIETDNTDTYARMLKMMLHKLGHDKFKQLVESTILQ